METTYSKSILITATLVAVVGVAALLWVLFKPELAPQPETSSTPPALSHEEKAKVMQDLAASSDASANLPIEKKAQVLQKTHTSSAASSESTASTGLSEHQMEILRSLRYSE